MALPPALKTNDISKAAPARPRLWRSLEEGTLRGAPDPRPDLRTIDRRHFMKLLGASLALAGSGCSRPPLEKIVPYRDGPSQLTYGKPVFYASTLCRDAYGRGVLVECNMGRPTKIEGNPSHPASLGATDVFAQAAVLDLWDPDRSKAPRNRDGFASWGSFFDALHSRLQAPGAKAGAGLRLLTEPTTSPTLQAQLSALLQQLPEARWHQWQPLAPDHRYAGARMAYGAPLDFVYRFERARVVLSLDADFLDGIPGSVRYALDFSATRRADARREARSRLYVLECTPSLTGAKADHRIALRATEVPWAARQLAHRLGILDQRPAHQVLPEAWLSALAGDLDQNRGASIVVAGERQPPHVHALAHALNERLGNRDATLLAVEPALGQPVDNLQSILDLARDMHNGRVETLVMLGTNPVYTAPHDCQFAAGLARVAFKLHHGLYFDETAARCDWHVPAAHPLESWADARAHDGTASLAQPGIAPLYDGRSDHEIVAALGGRFDANGRDLLREYWGARAAAGVDAFFEASLRSGLIAGTPSPRRDGPVADLASRIEKAAAADPVSARGELQLLLEPDSRIGDGRHANNAWLQELPKPLSQLVWDNAALVGPALAERLQLHNEDLIELATDGRQVEAPVWILPGMPDDSLALALGHGRSAAGSVGDGVGVDAYALRGSSSPWVVRGVSLARTGRSRPLATTQTHWRMEGRDLIRTYSADDAASCGSRPCSPGEARPGRSLYRSPPSGPYAWALSIDLSSCIGCGACTIACQAENNIPVVGRDEVRNGREMHWIRVDRYFEGSVDDAQAAFQPVPCMQCEHAPCEVVCPTEASIHDSQGINVQVYNRCIGTRFCSNNCPYKVRRFNFLEYSKNEPTLDAQRNPEVSVRMRGVMEKCNYCLQRITTAKIAADREGRRLRDGEVITACQGACPTRAIVFGDLNDPQSEVNQRKRSALDYTLLAELNTRPRTTYLARVTNRSAALPRQDQGDGD